jgi:hypothetical protein
MARAFDPCAREPGKRCANLVYKAALGRHRSVVTAKELPAVLHGGTTIALASSMRAGTR